MYSHKPSIIVGFHGCDASVRDRLVNDPKERPIPSQNDYDWLGHGFYFWENNAERALQWAQENPKIKNPAVLGAYIDLGRCLDLIDKQGLDEVEQNYQLYKLISEVSGDSLPKNEKDRNGVPMKRYLDCAVIESLHSFAESVAEGEVKTPYYDSVRGVFWEGEELYPGAGMKARNHIQVCVRNINCIKAFFIPRETEAQSPFLVQYPQ